MNTEFDHAQTQRHKTTTFIWTQETLKRYKTYVKI